MWDLLVIVLAVYNSILLPMEITFKPPWLETDFFKMINTLIDVLFAMDIILSFRTTY